MLTIELTTCSLLGARIIWVYCQDHSIPPSTHQLPPTDHHPFLKRYYNLYNNIVLTKVLTIAFSEKQ